MPISSGGEDLTMYADIDGEHLHGPWRPLKVVYLVVNAREDDARDMSVDCRCDPCWFHRHEVEHVAEHKLSNIILIVTARGIGASSHGACRCRRSQRRGAGSQSR